MPELRDSALQILESAIRAADAGDAVRRAISRSGNLLNLPDGSTVDLDTVARVLVTGAGKASTQMAAAAVDVLGDHVTDATLTTRRGNAVPVPHADVWEAQHPVPNTVGLAGATEALRLARSAQEDDLVLVLLSGGASALWPAPPDGVSLTDLQTTTTALLRSGAPIRQVNIVRKHLSKIAGGRLAAAADPARVITLAISDVIGSEPGAIGSGPTVEDPSTFIDALEVLRRFNVDAPAAVLHYLQAGAAGEFADTPGPGSFTQARNQYFVIADNRTALEAAARTAEELGFTAVLLPEPLSGEARELGRELARSAVARQTGERLALIGGGEPTVTVVGDGRGGRNQELALSAALVLANQSGIVLGSVGTDGIDGRSEAAGALVDGGTIARGTAAGLDAEEMLTRNDSNRYLEATGDLIVTGPTGTNVNDVLVVLLEPTGSI